MIKLQSCERDKRGTKRFFLLHTKISLSLPKIFKLYSKYYLKTDEFQENQ